MSNKEQQEPNELRRKFWEGLAAIAKSCPTSQANIKPNDSNYVASGSAFAGTRFYYRIVQKEASVELYINGSDTTKNKAIFDQIKKHKNKIDNAFGSVLSWEPLDTGIACRIRHEIKTGGYRSDPSNWAKIQSEMVDAMKRLEDSLMPELKALRL